MIDKFKIFNKVKINIDRYEEIEIGNNENLKIKMQERLNSSERTKKKRKRINIILTTAASISIIVVSVGVMSPSLADNFIKILPEFQTMLDKIKGSLDDESSVLYDPGNYPEREEEKEEIKKNKLIATPIDVVSKSNGLEITIDKAMYDKKKLYLDMTLKTDKPFKKSEYMEAVSDSPYGDGQKNMYIEDLKVLINGKEPNTYGYGPGVVEFIDEYSVNLSYLLELDINNDIEDANFKIDFTIPKYTHPNFLGNIEGKWSFDFNIKAMDDGKKHIEVNEKDGDYTLKSIDFTNTYVEVEMELPFKPSLGNPHNNFIIVMDDRGRELQLSTGTEGSDGISNQIYELIEIGQGLKYIDIIVVESHMDLDKPYKYLSNFRVSLD